MKFEWDIAKNKLNIQKHGLDFADTKELFVNGTLRRFADNRAEYHEIRFIGFGYVQGRLMNVIYTKRRPNIIRIISFRKANQREVKAYETNFKN